MALILPVKGKSPIIHQSVWVAENATITGDVTIGRDSSIWFQVVIRGDVNKIIIGEKVNIQDGSIVHGSYDKGDTFIGDNVSIGHGAIIHGCTIEADALIGMRATILDDVIIPPEVIIAAGSVVTSKQKIESGFIYGGIPAQKLKPLDEQHVKYYIRGTSEHYVAYSKYYSS